MKTPIIAIAAGALLAGIACAGPASELRATAQELFDVAGTYQLDNGLRANLLALDNRLYLDIGGHRQELVLTAPERFQTRDGSLTVQFEPEAFGGRILIGYWRGDRQPIPALLAAGRRQ